MSDCLNGLIRRLDPGKANRDDILIYFLIKKSVYKSVHFDAIMDQSFLRYSRKVINHNSVRVNNRRSQPADDSGRTVAGRSDVTDGSLKRLISRILSFAMLINNLID